MKFDLNIVKHTLFFNKNICLEESFRICQSHSLNPSLVLVSKIIVKIVRVTTVTQPKVYQLVVQRKKP